MSTKIYHAYRTKVVNTNSIIDWMREELLKAAKNRVEVLMVEVADEVTAEPPVHITDTSKEGKWHRYQQLKLVESKVATDRYGKYRELFALDCGFNLWFHGGYVYVIPVGPPYLFNGLDGSIPYFAEDFSYWDISDGVPDGVSEEVFKSRGYVWSKICTGTDVADHNARRLYHAVVDTKTYIGLNELKLVILDKC